MLAGIRFPIWQLLVTILLVACSATGHKPQGSLLESQADRCLSGDQKWCYETAANALGSGDVHTAFAIFANLCAKKDIRACQQLEILLKVDGLPKSTRRNAVVKRCLASRDTTCGKLVTTVLNSLNGGDNRVVDLAETLCAAGQLSVCLPMLRLACPKKARAEKNHLLNIVREGLRASHCATPSAEGPCPAEALKHVKRTLEQKCAVSSSDLFNVLSF